jgi:fructose-1,6-bisphosphatase/inositol monophosphatase family enzyme
LVVAWAPIWTRLRSFDGGALELSEPAARRLQVWVDGYSAVPDVVAGDDVAVHWGRLCGRLAPQQTPVLADATARQLAATNQRLARV